MYEHTYLTYQLPDLRNVLEFLPQSTFIKVFRASRHFEVEIGGKLFEN